MSATPAPATPTGSITCQLCRASISVKNGTFDKLQHHLETSHEVFYGFEVLMALIFLEDHEKEVIVEKVLPRMKLCLETARKKKDSEIETLDIEKRLFKEEQKVDTEQARESENSEKEKLLDDGKISEEENPAKRAKMELFDVSETLEINIDESDETLFFPDDKPKDAAECEICRRVLKKKSLGKHRTRCQLRERVRQIELAKQAKATQDENDGRPITIDGNNDQAEASDGVDDGEKTLLGCPACGKTLSSRTNLKRHLRNVHRDTSSRVY